MRGTEFYNLSSVALGANYPNAVGNTAVFGRY